MCNLLNVSVYRYYISVHDTYGNLDIAWMFDPFLLFVARWYDGTSQLRAFGSNLNARIAESAIGRSVMALIQISLGCSRALSSLN
jgi:hypothetical protein